MDNWKEVFTAYHKLKDLEERLERLGETEFIEEVRRQIGNLLDTYDNTEAEQFINNNSILV